MRGVMFVVLILGGCSEHGRSFGHVDAGVDANLLDAPCLLPHSEPCNPATQTNCAFADEKCTWLQFADPPHAGLDCASRGSRSEGETCAAVEGHTSSCFAITTDDCVAGTYCHVGVCRAICDLQLPSCTTGTCTQIDDVFLIGGNYLYGLCEP